jgi:hypothetical protein
MTGRGPDVARWNGKGKPPLGRAAYLTMNVYRAEWLDKAGRFHDEQVEASTASVARNKISRRFGVPKSKMAITLLMRKGAFRPTGLRTIK